MKGLKKTPSEKKLSQVYSILQTETVSEKQIALYSQWSRLDPRLAEILIQHLSLRWKHYHPIKLNSILRSQTWPAALGVLLNHVPIYHQQKTTNWKEESLFNSWSHCVMNSIPPAKNELFFIDLYKPGSKFLYREAFYSTKMYKKYGYLGKELLINKAKPSIKTLIPLNQRQAILSELLETRKTLTVKEYLSELQIPPKQAQRDLKNHPQLRSYGNTRNRKFVKISPKNKQSKKSNLIKNQKSQPM